MILVPDVGQAARHTRREVPARGAQNNHAAASHILAAMVASALNHGRCARVAHSKALAHASADVNLAACGAIQNGVSSDDVLLRTEVRFP